VAVRESWTDVGAKDPFVERARGRAIARFVDLIELVRMTDQERKGKYAESVK